MIIFIQRENGNYQVGHAKCVIFIIPLYHHSKEIHKNIKMHIKTKVIAIKVAAYGVNDLMCIVQTLDK